MTLCAMADYSAGSIEEGNLPEPEGLGLLTQSANTFIRKGNGNSGGKQPLAWQKAC